MFVSWYMDHRSRKSDSLASERFWQLGAGDCQKIDLRFRVIQKIKNKECNHTSILIEVNVNFVKNIFKIVL